VSTNSKLTLDPSDLPGLANLYLDGKLSAADRNELTELLRTKEECRAEFVRCMLHHVRLEELLARRRSETALNAQSGSDKREFPAVSANDTLQKKTFPLGLIGNFIMPQGNINVPGLLGVLLLSMLCGGAITATFLGRVAQPAQEVAQNVAGSTKQPGVGLASPPLYTASLVNVTNCRWDSARSTVDLSAGELRPGQALHLLEGVAKVLSRLPNDGAAEFQLEGPLAMMLTTDGMPSLLFGRLAGTFRCDFDRFTLDTPVGRITVLGDSTIGVSAAANEMELHIFSGSAMFEPWAKGVHDSTERLQANAGDSLHAIVGADSKLKIERGAAQEGNFVTPAAVAASQLRISPQYVASVIKSKPLAYWRFESTKDGFVRNEMSDYLHGRIVGDAVRLRGDHQNHTAEFGVTGGPGYLITDDKLDGKIADSYSLELWVKPTFHHHASLFNLIEWSPGETPVYRHRFQLELCPPATTGGGVRDYEKNGGRVRFYHLRSSSFSSEPYRVRQWQHLATVKEGSEKRLYVDGRLTATHEDPRNLGQGMRVLIGQCFPLNPHLKEEVSARLLMGELDEVAFYNRALSEEEIRERYELTLSEEPLP
jgi:hypothetical protein